MTGLGEIKAKREFAEAVSAAFVADIVRAPSITQAIRERKLGSEGLSNIARRELFREMYGKSGPVLFPNLRSLFRSHRKFDRSPLQAGMAGLGDVFDLLGTAVEQAAKVYTAKVEGKTQEAVAKLQTQQVVSAAELEAAIARQKSAAAQTSPAAPGGPGVPPYTVTRTAPTEEGGIPTWAIVAGAGTLGLGLLYFIVKAARG